jgi:predicted secreted protein
VHGVAAVAADSGGYQTYPVYDKTRLDHWRGIQTLTLRSKRIESLNTLVGRLQQRLQVKSMRFTVSPDQRQAGESRLIDRALDKFRTRALRIQKGLDAEGYDIVTLQLGAAGNPAPIPMARMTMARMENSAPVAGEAGTSRQTLSVHAVIQLHF